MPMELDYVTTLSPEILQKAQDELGEDEHLRAESVAALREWLKKQPHLKALSPGKNYHFLQTPPPPHPHPNQKSFHSSIVLPPLRSNVRCNGCQLLYVMR